MDKLRTYFSKLPVSSFNQADVSDFTKPLENNDFIFFALKQILNRNDPNAVMLWTPGMYGPSGMQRTDSCLNIILRNKGEVELLRLLFDAGAVNPDIHVCNDQTIELLLEWNLFSQDQLCSFINRYPGECNKLLSHVLDLNNVRDVLVSACSNGNTEIVKTFINCGLDLNFVSRWGLSPLTAALRVVNYSSCCSRYDDEECEDKIAQILIEAGADPHFKNSRDQDAFDVGINSKYIANLQRKYDLLELAKVTNYRFITSDYDSMLKEFKTHLSKINH